MANFERGRYGRYAENIITLGDFIVFALAFLITYLIDPGFTAGSRREILMATLVAYIPVAIFISRISKKRSLYMEAVVRYSLIAVICQAVVFIVLVQLLGVAWLHASYYYTFYPIAAVMLVLWSVIARKILKRFRRTGHNFKRVIIIGSGPTAQNLYKEMVTDAGFGYRFMGYFCDRIHEGMPEEAKYLGDLAALPEYIKEHRVDEIYYTLSGERHEDLRLVMTCAENAVAQFYYVPQINRFVNNGFYIHTVGSTPVLSLMPQPLESLTNRFLKRTFDIAVSSVFLVFFPLILIPVAIAIKISSPGPVFFKQKRTGYRGRDFYCWKFRTMRVNADADSKQAERNDPRKTRLGDILRKTSIDELPQFINVWLGDMSIVGPRPHMLKHTEEYSALISQYMVRHLIKPGITGWAQVNGYRGQTEELWQMEKRVEYDVWYIKNWSFLLDLKIMYRTVANAIRGEKNAF